MGNSCYKMNNNKNNTIIEPFNENTKKRKFESTFDDQLISKKTKTEETVCNVLKMLNATGTKEEMTRVANEYADSVGMDECNRTLLITLKTEGNNAFVKDIFEDQNVPGRTMSYFEMRQMYG
jgi:hypothetical protein